METLHHDAHGVAERVARESYGRLVAFLARRWRDLEAAEDALGDALATALLRWPAEGIPANPEGWLVGVAGNTLRDRYRRAAVARRAGDRLRSDALEAVGTVEELAMEHKLPDERLAMLFAAAHPAIDPPVRAPLMLQAVFGLSAERIAPLFLVTPAAMGRRSSRAKQKIREAGIPLEVPEEADRLQRLDAVLDAIYGAFTASWQDSAADGQAVVEEAIWLAELVTTLIPDEPEAIGLLALMLLVDARRGGRGDEAGFIPLAEQDPRLWNHARIRRADTILTAAQKHHSLGRYQLEAAIQSAHSARAFGVEPDPKRILVLYETLVRVSPTAGARASLAAALGRAGEAERGLAVLAMIENGEE